MFAWLVGWLIDRLVPCLDWVLEVLKFNVSPRLNMRLSRKEFCKRDASFFKMLQISPNDGSHLSGHASRLVIWALRRRISLGAGRQLLDPYWIILGGFADKKLHGQKASNTVSSTCTTCLAIGHVAALCCTPGLKVLPS